MDLTRVLGALLGGATRSPRRRRRTTQPFGGALGGRSSQAQIVRALAGLAGVAIEAMTRNQGQASAPPPSRPLPEWTGASQAPSRRVPQTGSPYVAPAEAPPAAEEQETLLLVRTMVAAAKADGAVDATERASIAGQLDAADLTPEERDFVLADFDTPLTPEALAAQAGDPMLRARLYAAAVAAMAEITPPERAWLDRFAKTLGLDRKAAAAIEERLAP
ncbi:DUF533 domain-containing protein [Falsiroseomonas sp. HC035]|uniref:DUF533 domain-containing protein n=1 Tax=Falsiroseomonas sp. HC035 TaxID=3390999 RepID=UPI003D3204C9